MELIPQLQIKDIWKKWWSEIFPESALEKQTTFLNIDKHGNVYLNFLFSQTYNFWDSLCFGFLRPAHVPDNCITKCNLNPFKLL